MTAKKRSLEVEMARYAASYFIMGNSDLSLGSTAMTPLVRFYLLAQAAALRNLADELNEGNPQTSIRADADRLEAEAGAI